MDRDERTAMLDTGEATATACIDDADTLEPILSDAGEPVRFEPDHGFPPEAHEADGGETAEITPAQIVEALLFSSDTPLSASRLAELSGFGSVTEIRLHIEELNEKYRLAGLTFRIEEIARGYHMLTQPQYHQWLAKLNKHHAQSRLTPAALEALSIVAYKQPVIRADIEAVRGVGCGEVLNRLRETGLVRIIGRADIVGRPMLYGTTRKFLDAFGLADLDDLPPMETLTLRPRASQPDAEGADQPDDVDDTPAAAAGA